MSTSTSQHDRIPQSLRLISCVEHARLLRAEAERDRLHALVNTPELVDFSRAVVLEAAHQRERWSADGDAGKGPSDWLWLVGCLAARSADHHKEAERLSSAAGQGGQADEWLHKQLVHHREKAVHHTITAAAALANWHARILGFYTAMRPGVDPASSPILSGGSHG